MPRSSSYYSRHHILHLKLFLTVVLHALMRCHHTYSTFFSVMGILSIVVTFTVLLSFHRISFLAAQHSDAFSSRHSRSGNTPPSNLGLILFLCHHPALCTCWPCARHIRTHSISSSPDSQLQQPWPCHSLSPRCPSAPSVTYDQI